MLSFGEFVKNKRTQNRITLREFCRRISVDPSNWSKIERGVLQPPKSKTVLNEIAKVLNINEKTEDYYTLFDLATISFLPKELVENESVVEKLPIFFRTLRGKKPSREELERLVELLQEG